MNNKEKTKIFDLLSFRIAFVLWTIIELSNFKGCFFENIESINAAVSNLFLLPFLYFIVHEIKRVYLNRKTIDGKYNIIFSLVFFLLLIGLLFLTWPGAWSWDDVSVAYGTHIYVFTPWQHFFSGLFQILCIEILPFLTGVIIIQILIASLIVGYSITTLTSLLNFKTNKTRIIISILLFIPFIMPPVVEYILGGFRMGIYSYIELLLIVKCIKIYVENNEIDNRCLFEILLLSIIVSCWRSEAIYYIVAIPLFLLLIGRKKIVLKRVLLFSFLLIVSNLAIGKINNNMIGQNNYSLLATMDPLVNIIREMKNNDDSDRFDDLSRVINIDIVKKDEQISGEAYWGLGLIKDNYSEEDYKAYMSAYIYLLKKYPNIAANSMWKMFYKSTGMSVIDGYSEVRSSSHISTATVFDLYDDDFLSAYMWKNSPSKLKEPINFELRNNTLKIIAGLNKDRKVTPIYYVTWNLFIPIILLLVAIILTVIKKKYIISLIGLSLIGKCLLIFITACAPYFMYYLSVYLIGYIYFIFNILYLFKKK